MLRTRIRYRYFLNLKSEVLAKFCHNSCCAGLRECWNFSHDITRSPGLDNLARRKTRICILLQPHLNGPVDVGNDGLQYFKVVNSH